RDHQRNRAPRELLARAVRLRLRHEYVRAETTRDHRERANEAVRRSDMEAAKIEQYGDELYRALRERFTVAPLTEREPEITVDDAYRVQLAIVARKLAREGVQHVGKKIGVTSEVVQKMLGVDQPDFGHLTSEMLLRDGDSVPTDRLLQPRAEGEIAFVLKRDLRGPGLAPTDVLAATDCVKACFEIVDSRIRDWKIK